MTSKCLVSECDAPVRTLRICYNHYQRAKRANALDALLETLPKRLCENCNSELPLRARSTMRFCCKRCLNSHAFKSNKDERLRDHKLWRDANRDERIKKSRDERFGSTCRECGDVLLYGSRRTRVFCSPECKNADSLRTHAHTRKQSALIRNRLMDGASVPGGVSKRDWDRLVNRHDGKCAYCGTKSKLTQDHVVPISRGGKHSIGNILPVCRSCNSSKKNALLIQWKATTLPKRLARL